MRDDNKLCEMQDFKRTVLIVDDEALNRELLGNIIETE
jgi:CheY-like chemotaxis protein